MIFQFDFGVENYSTHTMTFDINDFKKTLAWYCENADLNLFQLLLHWSSRITQEDFIEKSIEFIPINSPEQLAGEISLNQLTRKIPTVVLPGNYWSTIPGRDIDWGATALENLTNGESKFCCFSQVEIPDTQCLYALSGLTRNWINILESTPERLVRNKQNRLLILNDTLSRLPYRSIDWSTTIERKLRRFDRLNFLVIRSALDIWTSLSGKKLATEFCDWFSATESDKKDANLDALFEWFVAMSIAETATKENWSLEPETSKFEKCSFPDLNLTHDETQIALKISKGRPRNHLNQVFPSDYLSRVDSVANALGFTITGLQPDITLCFYKKNAPEKMVHFLADAKRNTGSGNGYKGQSVYKAFTYISAYNEILSYNPKFTLFFLDGSSTQNQGSQEVVCLDYNAIINNDSINAWFKDIFDNAKKTLLKINTKN